MIESQQGAQSRFGCNCLVSNERKWNNYFTTNNNEKSSLNLTDLVIFSFTSDAYSYHICRSWCNGSYSMAAKPIKTLELRYPVSQFLITEFIK